MFVADRDLAEKVGEEKVTTTRGPENPYIRGTGKNDLKYQAGSKDVVLQIQNGQFQGLT